MKRIIIRISLVMLLGMVTSVAVAWGCAWRYASRGFASGPSRAYLDYSAGKYDLPDYSAATSDVVQTRSMRVGYYRHVGLGVEFLRQGFPDVQQAPDRAFPYWSVHAGRSAKEIAALPRSGATKQFAVGLPFRSAECEIVGGFFENVSGAFVLGVTQANPSGTHLLPYRPIWFGAIANAVFCAGLCWLTIFGPSVTRRWWRRRHGRCANCGYDLRGITSDTCPECGAQR